MNGLESHKVFNSTELFRFHLYSTSLRSFYSFVIIVATNLTASQGSLEGEALCASFEELALVLVEAVATIRGEVAAVAVKLGLFDVRLALVAFECRPVLEDFLAHPALVDLGGLIQQPVSRCQLQFLLNEQKT